MPLMVGRGRRLDVDVVEVEQRFVEGGLDGGVDISMRLE